MTEAAPSAYPPFRQSTIKTYRHCPEQARLDMFGITEDFVTDSAAVGTGTHAAIEAHIRGSSVDQAVEIGFEVLSRELAHPNFKPHKWAHGSNSPYDWIQRFMSAYEKSNFSRLLRMSYGMGLLMLEAKVEMQVQTPKGRIVTLQGTIDVLDGNGGRILDWKTGSSFHLDRRTDPQPTMYTLLASNLIERELSHFTWVFLKNGDFEVIDSTRFAPQHQALLFEIDSICDLIDAGLPHWPLDPGGWWCSELWCPAYRQCIGSFYD